MNNRLLTYILPTAVALLASSATACRNTAERENVKPVITVSIEPQRWMLERIVGERMEVRTLMDRGGNPESYEPTFSHLAALEQSAAYMSMGHLAFEEATVQKLRSNNPDLPVICVSDSVALITDSHDGHEHGVDPHTWSSARNVRIVAGNMLTAVCALDSANAPEYRRNYSRLVATIDSVDSVCHSMLDSISSASFMVMHPSLSYFARDYGLRQIAAGTEGKENSVGELRRLIDSSGALGSRVFLVQKDFDATRADVLGSDGRRIPIVTINPLNYNWDDELINTARAIATGE